MFVHGSVEERDIRFSREEVGFLVRSHVEEEEDLREIFGGRSFVGDCGSITRSDACGHGGEWGRGIGVLREIVLCREFLEVGESNDIVR